MCGSEDWPYFANERRLLLCLLDEWASSQFKPGKSWFVPVLLFLIHLAMTSECKYTAWFSRLVLVLQFVFILCSKLRWFPTSKWVKFVPKSGWIDLPMVRQRRKLLEKQRFPPFLRWKNEMNGPFLHGTSELEMKHNCSRILLLKMASGNIRKVMTLTQSETVRNTNKDDTWLLWPHFFVKMIRKSLFRPIKERRNDKPKTIQVSLQGHAKTTLSKKIVRYGVLY